MQNKKLTKKKKDYFHPPVSGDGQCVTVDALRLFCNRELLPVEKTYIMGTFCIGT